MMHRRLPQSADDHGLFGAHLKVARLHALGQPVEVEIDHRGGKEGEHLRKDESAHDADTERHAKFGAHAAAECQGKSAKERRQCGHHDRPEAQQTGLEDGFFSRFALLALGLERKVDHHDGVLLHNADEQDDADQRNHAEFHPA